MTEEEAWALDDLVTKTDITLGPNGSDWLSQQGARIADMPDEESNALDEKQTRTIPAFAPDGSLWLSRREARITGMDEDAAAWLRVKAESAHTSVGQIINELVREKIAASQ
jgi:hypothetical protein